MASLNFPAPYNKILEPSVNRMFGPLNVAAVLAATLRIESNWGTNIKPRFEPSYAPGGSNYEKNKANYALYGELAASSIGPLQFMLLTAQELDFTGHPNELNDINIALPLAINLYIKRFVKKGGVTPQQAYRAYNAGNIYAAPYKLGTVKYKGFLERLNRFAGYYYEELEKVKNYLSSIKPIPFPPQEVPIQQPQEVPVNGKIVQFPVKPKPKSIVPQIITKKNIPAILIVLGFVVLGVVVYISQKEE